MIKMKKLKVPAPLMVFLKFLAGFLSSQENVDKYKKDPNAFTRNRKLSAQDLAISLIAGNHAKSVRTLLDDFFFGIGRSIKITTQAFSKARAKLGHVFFEKAFYESVNAFVKSTKLETYKGLLPVAVDGSHVPLPKGSKEIKEKFGLNNSIPMGLLTSLYLPLNKMFLALRLTSFHDSERSHLLKYLGRNFIPKGYRAIYIADRGYPSHEIFYKFKRSNEYFLFRYSKAGLASIKNLPLGLHDITIQGSINLRVLKFLDDYGQEFTLVTNATFLTVEDLKYLYKLRWETETEFDTFKNKLSLTRFTGKTVNSIYQDLYALAIAANIEGILFYYASSEITRQNFTKDLKYRYLPNISEIVGLIHRYLVFILKNFHSDETDSLCQKLFESSTYAKIPVRPDRHVPRHKRKVKKNPSYNRKSN